MVRTVFKCLVCVTVKNAMQPGLQTRSTVHRTSDDTLDLFSLYSDYPRTDFSDIDQASLFHLTLISLSFSLISFMPIFFLLNYSPVILRYKESNNYTLQ